MLGVILQAGLVVVFAQFPTVQDPRERLQQPKLLVKDRAYLIHAVPTQGLAIVHLTSATGEMKLLASGGKWVVILSTAYDRVLIQETRIAGVALDRERLYILEWRGLGGGIFAPQGGISRPDVGTYRLRVFRLHDGQLLHTANLKGDHVPREVPKETVEPGPLRLDDRGITCFGRRFEFQGTELRKPHEKRP